MEVIPVIDLKGGVVVHARAGDRKAYQPLRSLLAESAAPDAVLRGLLRFYPFGVLYVADLDAIEGRGDHGAEIAGLASLAPKLDIWVDNGISTATAAKEWLRHNAGRLVIGSESQRDEAAVAALTQEPRVVLSLDFRGDTFQGPAALFENAALWPERVIVMTLGRVGSSAGPDLARLSMITARAPDRFVYAAGGIRDIADLRSAHASGAAGALVATALHNGAVTAADLQDLYSTTGSVASERVRGNRDKPGSRF
jgi:phosphoribosylformimino-5-aminoimidazole carboxamide ribotide isomerase